MNNQTRSPAMRVTFTNMCGGQESRAHMDGFIHLWAVYVTGFDRDEHCKKCLRGLTSAFVGKDDTPVGKEIVFDEKSRFNALYICGVSAGRETMRGGQNLHLPLEYAAGNKFEVETYSHYSVLVKNARLLDIPELQGGYRGLGKEFWRCKNFRFGVHRFEKAG
jgi:hypothetical protein